ncbi:MAG: hypothetical protein WAQ05_05350 [Rubrivivax sp.]
MSSDAPPPIGSRSEFQAAVRWGLQTAIAAGARRIVAIAPSFADWPLDEPALHQALAAWLRLPQRRLVLLAANYDAVPRRHARFVAWRTSWSHAIDTRSPAEGDTLELPTLLLDDGATTVHLLDPVHWRGRAACDARIAHQWRDEIDAHLQRSEPAFPVNALGL